MPFPQLEQFLSRRYDNTLAGSRVWLDRHGRAQGRYFNSTLTSAFQPVRALNDGKVMGYEGFARSYSDTDQGLCLWKLLDHAANDDESVELDRLCRMLHAINFFRQSEAAGSDLFLSVHARLLAAVEGNHGIAFSRVLQALGLPKERIVLQLPEVTEHQGWLLNYVADNYRRNGFRIAVNALDASEAATLVERVRPDVVKVDTRQGMQDGPVLRLLDRCARQNVRAVFKRLDNRETLDALAQISAVSGRAIYAQGFLWDLPGAALATAKRPAQLQQHVLVRQQAGVA